jgi:hypothetical protein
MSETILYRKVQSSLIDIGNDNLLRALDLRNSRTQQTHSSSAVHHHSRILRHQAPPESMQRDTERLKQSTDIQAHALGQLVAPLRRVVDLLLQRALEVREALAAAPELQLFANVVPAFRAAGTASARQADFKSDFVADFEVCDGRADGGDDAGGLMAE